MRTTLEPPRTREVPEQRPLTKKEAKAFRAALDAHGKPQKRWPARRKLLAGISVLAVAGGVAIGIGIATQSGGDDTSVSATVGSANSAEYRAGLTVPGGSVGSANSAEYRAGLTVPGGSVGSANSAEYRAGLPDGGSR